jgi:hypothetical protein
MSGLCLGVAFSVITASVPVQTFTLVWVHSIEKIRWEEDYRIEGNRLVLSMARVRGSGAGMEPPEGAVLRNGVYEYRPAKAVQLSKMSVARSPYTADYQLCWDGRCTAFAQLVGPPVGGTTDLFPCPSK